MFTVAEGLVSPDGNICITYTRDGDVKTGAPHIEEDQRQGLILALDRLRVLRSNPMRGFYTIVLLIMSNIFMTFAWYGHLKFKEMSWFSTLSLPAIIILSWSIALFEYAFQVPANRIGSDIEGGPFTLWQLKIIQEAITLIIFSLFTIIFFKDQGLRWNHLVGFALMVGAVYFVFRD